MTRVIKIIDQVKVEDLNDLPDTLEVLYLPFLAVEDSYNFNFPPMLNRLYIGVHPSKVYQHIKVPYMCKVIHPDYTNPDYYNEFSRIDKLFKEEYRHYSTDDVLFIKKENLKRLQK
jgi:hypothetical protein